RAGPVHLPRHRRGAGRHHRGGQRPGEGLRLPGGAAGGALHAWTLNRSTAPLSWRASWARSVLDAETFLVAASVVWVTSRMDCIVSASCAELERCCWVAKLMVVADSAVACASSTIFCRLWASCSATLAPVWVAWMPVSVADTAAWVASRTSSMS